MRIVSLVPSLTEFLYDLGLDDEVVGITKFCIHPEKWYKEKTRIGGTKNPHLDKILGLKPDLVIANKEENRKEDVEALQNHCKVLITDINSIEEQRSALLDIGKAVGRAEDAKREVEKITQALEEIIPLSQKKSALYLIWNNPIMSVAQPTFIDEMLQLCNIENLGKTLNHRSRYPSLSETQLLQLNPDLLLLSSEPFPFKEKHLLHFKKMLPKSKIILVDGELFSWYGSRIQFFGAHWQVLKGRIES